MGANINKYIYYKRRTRSGEGVAVGGPGGSWRVQFGVCVIKTDLQMYEIFLEWNYEKVDFLLPF